MKSVLPVLLLASSGLQCAYGQEGSQWGLGAAVIAQDQGYVDVGSETNFVPAVFYRSENFFLLGPRFTYSFLKRDNWEAAVVGSYRFDGYEPDDSDFLAGMEERKGAFELGGQLSFNSDIGSVSLTALADVTSEHKGNEFTLTYSYPYQYGAGRINPFVSVTHSSDDLIDYYYGVRIAEATASRPFYLGEATTNFSVGVQSSWMQGKNHMWIMNASYTAYGSEIKDSPLIDASGNAQVILGYAYVF